MKDLFVIAEHRRGELREITFEMLCEGEKLAKEMGANLTAVLLGFDIDEFVGKLSNHAARVLVVKDERLKEPNLEAYQKVLSRLIAENKPVLVIVGHTAFGLEVAPSLATELNIPLVTDCIGLEFKDGVLTTTRQIYGGKVNAKVWFSESETYMVTIRPAAFPAEEREPMKGAVTIIPSPLSEDIAYKQFIQYVEEAVKVDITKADVLVAVGRGVGDVKNISIIEELAQAMGGIVACSRPIVDKKWLPKDRHVGTSGKTVKPKLYLAMGISGAFQHVSGMKDSDLIVAINKDPKAPIFRVADYGIVDDMFKVIPLLKDKINEAKSGSTR